MSPIAGYEVVVVKRPRFFVPPICAGCGGAIRVVRQLAQPTLLGNAFGSKLRLDVGLCRGCDGAYMRRERPGAWIGLGAFAAGLLAGVVLLVAPPLPAWAIGAITTVVVVLAVAALRHRFRAAPVATGETEVASPYRAVVAYRTPPIPIQLVSVGRTRAILFVANQHWAGEVAAVNELELRAPTVAPGIPYAWATSFVALGGSGLVALGVWHVQWPVVLLDNTRAEPITIHVDGAPRWQLPARPADGKGLEVRLARGLHVFGHQRASSSTIEGVAELRVDGVARRDRKLYDPLASGCYVRDAVVYSDGVSGTPSYRASYLPPTHVVEPQADHVFDEPPSRLEVKRNSHQVRWVIVRDNLCADMVDVGCKPATVDAYRTCIIDRVKAADVCADQAVKACEAQFADAPSEPAPAQP
jgi:hypothetical protein